MTMSANELSGLQRPGDLVVTEDDAGRRCVRADQLEGAWRSSLLKETLPRAQQDRIDHQQRFVRKPMFKQRRCQGGAARENEGRAVLRLDAANAGDHVRSNRLDRPPLQTLPTVSNHE